MRYWTFTSYCKIQLSVTFFFVFHQWMWKKDTFNMLIRILLKCIRKSLSKSFNIKIQKIQIKSFQTVNIR